MCADTNYNSTDNILNNNENKENNHFYNKKRHEHRPKQRHSAASTSGQKQGLKWSSNTFLSTSIILLLCQTSHVLAIRKGRLMSPSSFTALSGDLHVQIQFNGEDMNEGSTGETISGVSSTTPQVASERGFTTLRAERRDLNISGENTITSTLVISKIIDDIGPPELARTNASLGAEDLPTSSRGPMLQRKRKEIVQNIPLYPDPRHNVTQVAVPCQTFVKGGLYEMQVVTNLKTTAVVASQNSISNATRKREQRIMPTIVTTTLMPISDERLRQTLDVRWPSAEMRVSPIRLRTYPESPVQVTLRFPEVNCDRAWRSEDMPEFWLELVYCGKERTCGQLLTYNISKSNILYAEQVHGYPKEMIVKLKCELFGLAGNYVVQLRAMLPAPKVPITRRFLTVDWSDKFVFNVYARSIFPCDPHTGIGVLYEYPACILEQGDRVRVYAKLRADVASLKPPTSLHYVAEQRVVKSQYSLYFSCDLFTEKYVEYCFVYVSQAISGAVADVRMDCVPTLPVSDYDTGGWGLWSEWTPCSTNCLGGTRNRYRFCDSPPPRYGAKFCEGSSVETEKCGETISNTWDCIYETSGTPISKANRTEVNQEIGPGCRCGCIVHLGSSKPKRILAGATQSCPGRSFWLIQVDGEEYIALSLHFLRLPCSSQYIKVRDGPSLSSTLLIELNGGSNLNVPTQMESSGAQLLLEFYAGDEATLVQRNGSVSAVDSGNTNVACTGGFLANAEQIAGNDSITAKTVLAASTRVSEKSRTIVKKLKKHYKFTLVHLSAVVFASIIILISALLGVQYVVRYRKYHLAVARRRDEGSRLHTPHASMHSLQSPPSRALSTTTLLSEVIYLVKIRPKHQLRHSILRESVDAENLDRETDFIGVDRSAQMAKCNVEQGSTGSIVTLRNEVISSAVNTLSHSPSMDELAENNVAEHSSSSGTLKRKDSAKDSESIISSGMSSIYNSPPMNSKRFSKYSDRYDAATLKIRNSRFEDSMTDCDSLRSSLIRVDYEHLCQLSARSGSVSLTNGCYSPAVSVISTATIRTTNPKESKEKQNRRKLLARPGSEFSLGNQEELELDYYDYNVINAGAAPGSYLGMDPAYLVWIPPFDGYEHDDDKTPEPSHEPDETEPLYEEIRLPKHVHYLSARSNTESSTNTTNNTTPTSDAVSPLDSHQQSKATIPSETNLRNYLVQQATSSVATKQATPFLYRKKHRQEKQQSKSTLSLGSAKETLPLHELSGTRSARDIAVCPEVLVTSAAPSTSSEAITGSYVEKETTVVKSPSDLQNFLALDDIQFVDESESDIDREERNVTTKDLFRDEEYLKGMQQNCTGSGIRPKLPVYDK